MVSEILDTAVMPGIQGGPLMHVIAAKAIAYGEALDPKFKLYAADIVKNAKTMADAVEIFKEFCPSPPVPHVSMVFKSALTLLAFSLKTKIPPANSSLVSPFFISASKI